MFKLNTQLKILLSTNGLILVAGGMLAPIYALFVEEIGGSLLDASSTVAFFAIAAGITTLFAGKYTDKVKEKEYIVVIGYAIMGIGFLGYIIVDSLISLLVVQAIIGFAEAFYVPAFDALYSTYSKKRLLGRSWGMWESLNYFTIAIGALVGGVLATRYGFDILFGAMSVLCFISAMYIVLLPRKIL